VGGAVERYRALARDFDRSPVAARALARVGELWPNYAAREWKALELSLPGFLNRQKYRQALQALSEFDSRFSGTEAAAAAPARVEAVRTAARASLDAVRQRVAPLLATD